MVDVGRGQPADQPRRPGYQVVWRCSGDLQRDDFPRAPKPHKAPWIIRF